MRRTRTGAGRLSPPLYYARLTQRLVTALTAPTKAGLLYEVDLRLRPSGRKGPLATSLAAFALYQREEAETWEHMALTRARVVAGDAALARDIAEVARAALVKPREARAARARNRRHARADRARERRQGRLRSEARAGRPDRHRVSRAIPDARACERAFPRCCARRRARRWRTAARAGLISAADGEALAEAHRLMTAVTQVLRLTLPDDAEPAGRGGGRQAPHRRRCGRAGFRSAGGEPRRGARAGARRSSRTWALRRGDKVAKR